MYEHGSWLEYVTKKRAKMTASVNIIYRNHSIERQSWIYDTVNILLITIK